MENLKDLINLRKISKNAGYTCTYIHATTTSLPGDAYYNIVPTALGLDFIIDCNSHNDNEDEYLAQLSLLDSKLKALVKSRRQYGAEDIRVALDYGTMLYVACRALAVAIEASQTALTDTDGPTMFRESADVQFWREKLAILERFLEAAPVAPSTAKFIDKLLAVKDKVVMGNITPVYCNAKYLLCLDVNQATKYWSGSRFDLVEHEFSAFMQIITDVLAKQDHQCIADLVAMGYNAHDVHKNVHRKWTADDTACLFNMTSGIPEGDWNDGEIRLSGQSPRFYDRIPAPQNSSVTTETKFSRYFGPVGEDMSNEAILCMTPSGVNLSWTPEAATVDALVALYAFTVYRRGRYDRVDGSFSYTEQAVMNVTEVTAVHAAIHAGLCPQQVTYDNATETDIRRVDTFCPSEIRPLEISSRDLGSTLNMVRAAFLYPVDELKAPTPKQRQKPQRKEESKQEDSATKDK